jgi:hypothetical protein
MANFDLTDLTVTAWDGSTQLGVWNLTNLQHDANQQYDLIASAGQVLTAVDMVAGDGSGIKQTKQFEISGVVPEPSTWAMMIIGFAGLGYAGFRKAKSRFAAA